MGVYRRLCGDLGPYWGCIGPYWAVLGRLVPRGLAILCALLCIVAHFLGGVFGLFLRFLGGLVAHCLRFLWLPATTLSGN